MAYVWDLIDPTDLNGYIRGLSYEENLYKFALSQFLPARDIPDVEFRITRGNLQDVDAAMYRTFDTEAPIAKRIGGTRITGEIPPLSSKIPLGEEAQLRLRAEQSGDNSALVGKVYDDAANRTRAILARLELARGAVLNTGKLILSENGVAATIDYGRKSSHDVAAGVLWSDWANSDPVTDLINWQIVYRNDNGVDPGFTLISVDTLNNLLHNAKLRILASVITGAPQIVSRTNLNQVIADFGIPPLFVYDGRVRVAGTQTRVIPANRVVFLPPLSEPLGNVLMGITAEAQLLAARGYITSEQQPGITVTVMTEDDPVITWTKASALAMPVLANPDLTFAATVA